MDSNSIIKKAEAARARHAKMREEIDQIEEDLLAEKMKIKAVSDDLDQTFTTMLKF